MCQSANLFWKQQFKMLVVFPPIFVVDTKIILVYNSVAPLKPFVFNNSIKNEKFILLKNDEVIVNELI